MPPMPLIPPPFNPLAFTQPLVIWWIVWGAVALLAVTGLFVGLYLGMLALSSD